MNATQGAAAVGRIDRISGDRVFGWLYSPASEVLPVLYVDGDAAELVRWPSGREDVSAATGAPRETGWEFRVRSAQSGARIALYALTGGALQLVAERTIDHPVVSTEFWAQLERVAHVSAARDSVAVTSWDGAHNPIGRAKVLYDILANNRPVAMISYIMGEFGKTLWPPIADADIPILTIPWDRRGVLEPIVAGAGVAFSTIWVCKPRLPNFYIASLVGSPTAKVILDLDDNDDHFSRSTGAATKPYGGGGLSMSKFVESKIHARTVASAPLQRDYGGEVVRHVRESVVSDDQTVRDPKSPVRVGFIGTVRPHKNILGAAKAVAMARWLLGVDIEFSVRGDIRPASLIDELKASGAEVGGLVPADELQDAIAELDIVLTGFSSADSSSQAANEYQITSKIGDALAQSKHVLVPMSPSVADLDGIPGIHLFEAENFYEVLREAIQSVDVPELPSQFTVNGGLEGFAAAEHTAETSPRAEDVFRELIAERQGMVPPQAEKRTLLLLWKQHDAALYGRRVDQIARAWKRAHPEYDVRILEILHDADVKQYRERAKNHFSEAASILGLAEMKSNGGLVDPDGVIHNQIHVRAMAEVDAEVMKLLARYNIMPWNSVVVVFPHNRFYDQMRGALQPFIKIVDVVDNQLSWAAKNDGRARSVALQYNELARAGDAIVFNSSRNHDYFLANRMLEQASVAELIPNWYMAPSGWNDSHVVGTGCTDGFDVIYSGNMNDRIDWPLVISVARIDSRLRLHLVGGAERAATEFRNLIELPNVVYHGPKSERYVMDLLSRADVAIMPHTTGRVSDFMNPLKLHMYEAAGIPTVCTAVEGIDAALPGLVIADTAHDFLMEVSQRFQGWAVSGRRAKRNASGESGSAAEYIALIDAAFSATAERPGARVEGVAG